ncbi:hypothetical protein [uncultured Erythrobacter sp.]|uniref:hypothetical protein n=1 Tax=uncultured Erythrobacter sp. TaxID=263913 RepID=UPI00260214EC|nr:hypothetical protein [uncultured Erythrobacter sp.]
MSHHSQIVAQTQSTRAFPRALQAEFLRILAEWGNVRAAAKAVGGLARDGLSHAA